MAKQCMALVLMGALVGACGGPQASLRKENDRLQTRMNELRSQARTDRNKIRDLENQLFLLEDKLETAEVDAGRVAEPELPVEVLEPEPWSDDPASAPRRAGEYEVVGIDEEGNEIVYVGDAARDHSVSPSMDKYLDEPDRAPAARSRGDDQLPPVPPVPEDGHRLTVTDDVPTIDSQLRDVRRARSADDAARKRYQRHYASLRAGKHASAIAGFRAFVEEYGAHDYADNAQYWLGEAYYDQKQYKRAMREFRRVVKRYPRGNKVPDALLKIGYCYAALDELAKARDVLAQVARVYPSSSSAKLARSRLAELEK